jgi:hypothetical protein
MRSFFSQMNPTVRGLLVVALIAFLVVALNLYVTLAALYAIAGIAFFLAIAFFVYLLWRDRRQEIATWPTQAKIAFYLGAFTIVFALGSYFVTHPSGLDALAFLLVLGFSGFGMWRVWRDQHTYGY